MPKISASVRVERPLEDLADLLGTRPPEWLVSFASIAVHCGDAAGARRAGMLRQTSPRRVRRIAIDLTDVPQTDDASRIDAGLVWETRGFHWVFSTFDGHIVATRETDYSCTISIEGSYAEPRMAAPGEDDAVRTAVETSLSMLLSTLRDAVEEQARTSV